MRIILYTGKGGVGKTSVSAATAVKCAKLGYKTLVMSTDSAHSLRDSFEIEIGNDSVEIENNLFAQEININQELSQNWGKIQSYITTFLKSQGFEQIVAEELAILPGMEELFSLLKLLEYYEKNEYDVAVVDCAPTSSTVRLLSFPDAVKWYMEKFFHIERKVLKAVRPVAKHIVKAPLPTDEVFYSLEDLYKRVNRMKEVLTDGNKTTIRLVINPEKMVIKEAQRAYSYLNLFGFSIDGIITNRVLPEKAKSNYFDKWLDIQKRYLKLINESFQPLPIFISYLFQEEVVGKRLLAELADQLFQDKDPSKVFYNENPINITQKNGNYLLSIKLPFTTKEELNLWVKGDELILRLKDFQRNILLPRVLSTMDIKKALFDNGRFNIFFGK